MVHTAELVIELTAADMKYISTKTPLRGDINHITLGISFNEAISLNILKGRRKSNRKELFVAPNKYFTSVWRAYLVVDFIKLLNTPNIFESDITKISSKLEHYLCNFIVSDENYLELRRIDYRFDARIDDEIVRAVLIKLYKKCLDKKHYMVKETTHKTSIIYFSKSRRDNVYDKETERKEKGKTIKDYERNILRFEAQILQSHLCYLKKSQGLVKVLENYLDENMYRNYMDKMIVQTFYQGDYYDIYRAKKLINQSVEFKNSAEEILDFMIDISKEGSVSKVLADISKYKYDKYIKILQKIGVNPILIPKHHRISFIENPLKPLYSR